ncbi:hypothetical protein KY362_02310 [Candidatus Woesearchaeota archaeon]|nr:hypothetical protein [Candidatus Woesearchaeota archaeon]
MSIEDRLLDESVSRRELADIFLHHAKQEVRQSYWKEAPEEEVGPATSFLGKVSSYLMNLKTRQEMLRELRNAANDMDSGELIRRITEKDFDLEPDEARLRDMEFRSYASEVVKSVQEKDYTVWRYPVPYFGYFGLGAGMYQGLTGEAEKGMTYMVVGAAVLIGGLVVKNLLLLRSAKKTLKFLESEGYEKFDNYYRDREPYDIYHYKVLGKTAE